MANKIIYPKITTNLWFNKQAAEAVNFYQTVFKNFQIGRKTYYTKEGFEHHQMPAGTLLTIEFELEGQSFVALNGGPMFTFNEAISFIVNCENQEEIDYYWEKLSAGGDPEAQVCGWLKDKFGVSWQIVPTELIDMLQDEDEARKNRVMAAMFKMKKLDLAAFRSAYNQD